MMSINRVRAPRVFKPSVKAAIFHGLLLSPFCHLSHLLVGRRIVVLMVAVRANRRQTRRREPLAGTKVLGSSVAVVAAVVVMF